MCSAQPVHSRIVLPPFGCKGGAEAEIKAHGDEIGKHIGHEKPPVTKQPLQQAVVAWALNDPSLKFFFWSQLAAREYFKLPEHSQSNFSAMVNQVPRYKKGRPDTPVYRKQVKGVSARPATVAEMQKGYKDGDRLGQPTGVRDKNGHLPRNTANGQQLAIAASFRNSSAGSSSSAASLSGNKRSRSGAVIKH
jgi:hypothetical protein